MKNYKNIYLLGSSHIASQSVNEAKENIDFLKPDIVALELDSGRAYSLKHKVKRPKNISLIKSLGLTGFLFYVFGEYIQKKLGKIVNIEPGAEMLSAMHVAEEKGLMITFIDRDINITLARFSKYFRKRELFRLFFELIGGIFKKETVKIDISKPPSEDIVQYVLAETKKRYPSHYMVLIDERDLFMADALFQLSNTFPDKKVFAVVGAGHVNGILHYLKERGNF